MMPEDRFARTVHDWLTAAAPTEAPDRILDAVAARVNELEQQARSRWASRLATAAAVSAVVILGGAALYAGISRVGSPTPSPSVPAAPSSIHCETAPCSFTMVEGTEYASSTFDLGVTMRAPSDRWLVAYDEPGLFRLVAGRDERRNVTILLDPTPTDALGQVVAVEADRADAFARWLRQRDQLIASAPIEVAVAGLTGWAVDIRGDAEFPTQSDGCMSDGLCAAIFAYRADGKERIYGAASVDAIRLYLLDTADHLVVIAVEARHSAPVGFLDGEAQELLQGLHIVDQP